MRKVSALLVVIVVVLAACTTDDSTSTESKAEGTTTQPPPGVDAAEDQAIVDDAVLQLSDLPAGWRQETDDDDDDDDSLDLNIDECGEIRVAGEANDAASVAEATSGPFSQSQAEIENKVGSSSSEEPLAAFLDALSDTDEANMCFEAMVTSALEDVPLEPGQEFSIGDPTVGRTSIGEFGDQTVSYQVEVPVEVQGMSPSIYVDFVFVRVGRYYTTFSFLDIVTPFSPQQEQEIVGTVVDRLQTALTASESS